MSVEHLLRAKKNRDNEYYTCKDAAELFINYCDNIVRNILKLKAGSTIWLPADSDKSEITIAAKNKWPDYNVINTSDDYYSHEDIRDKADFICTNPPFTNINKTAEYFSKKPFVIMCPAATQVDFKGLYYTSPYSLEYDKINPNKYRQFIKQDGQKVEVSILYATNIKDAYVKKISKKNNITKHCTYLEPLVNKTVERKDYYEIKDDEEYVTIPSSQICCIDYDEFEIVGYAHAPHCYISLLLRRK